MILRLQATPYTLRFLQPFGIAHGTRDTTDTLYVRATFGDYIGYGEAALPPYLGYTVDTLAQLVNARFAGPFDGSESIAGVLTELGHKDSDLPPPVRCAMDMAMLDLWGHLTGKPVRTLIGIEDKGTTLCSYTLGISSIAVLKEKVQHAGDFRLFKIKLGGDNDRERVAAFLEVSKMSFCVDANQCWNSVEEALIEINLLKEQGCLFVEQPLKTALTDQYEELYKKSPLPIILDESIQQSKDLDALSVACHGINVKLVKCGGITPALDLIRQARKLRKQVLIGCMSESTCGAAGAAQLAGLADWVDLDGPKLIGNDPFGGVEYKEGCIVVKDLPGLGISLQNSSLF